MSTAEKQILAFDEAIMRSWSLETNGRSYVLFSSPTCGPCVGFKKIIQQVEAEGTPMSYIDVSHAMAIAAGNAVRAVPTLIRFEKGKETARLTGNATEEKIRSFVKE